jgi:hypothetical protein
MNYGIKVVRDLVNSGADGRLFVYMPKYVLNISGDGDHLDSGEGQILCGSEEDFSCLSGTGTILFVNLSSWNRRIHVQGMTLAGIRGWAWLTEFLFHELYTAAQYRRG